MSLTFYDRVVLNNINRIIISEALSEDDNYIMWLFLTDIASVPLHL